MQACPDLDQLLQLGNEDLPLMGASFELTGSWSMNFDSFDVWFRQFWIIFGIPGTTLQSANLLYATRHLILSYVCDHCVHAFFHIQDNNILTLSTVAYLSGSWLMDSHSFGLWGFASFMQIAELM